MSDGISDKPTAAPTCLQLQVREEKIYSHRTQWRLYCVSFSLKRGTSFMNVLEPRVWAFSERQG